MIKSFLLISSLSILLTSCAGIIHGTDQTVTFTSEPSGATVLIDGMSRGKTPLSVKLKKNAYDTVMIKMDGYRAITRPLNKQYDSIALLNVFWDLSTTDMITGAAYEYEPNTYHFELEKDKKWTFNNKKLDEQSSSFLRKYILLYFTELQIEATSKQNKYSIELAKISKKNIQLSSIKKCFLKHTNFQKVLACLQI